MRALGKLAPAPDPRVPALKAMLGNPWPPEGCNWYAEIGEWPMLGNNEFGCCVEAAVLHCLQQRWAYVRQPITVDDAAALALYSSWTGFNAADPSTDQGTVVSDSMARWKTDGVPLHGGAWNDKLTAYASVDHVSIPWLKAAIWHCGAVLLGIRCPLAWTEADYLLDLPDGQVGDIAGGHCGLLVGYEPTALGTEFDVITWGARFRVTERALGLVADEAYAPLDRDWMDADGKNPAGVDWAAAEAAMRAIG